MNFVQRTIGVTIISAALAVTTGCDTTTGALSGAGVGAGLGAIIGGATGHPEMGAAIGLAAGTVTGAIIGHINEEQRAKLQQQSPQTLQTIQHNDDAVAAAKKDPAQPAPQDLKPLTVDDIKALTAAGVKSDVIIAEIGTSKTVYTQQDIDTAQQASPAVDPTIIDCMKKTKTS